jgi:hypothetical protein
VRGEKGSERGEGEGGGVGKRRVKECRDKPRERRERKLVKDMTVEKLEKGGLREREVGKIVQLRIAKEAKLPIRILLRIADSKYKY